MNCNFFNREIDINEFNMIRRLGMGACGVVSLVENDAGQLFAAKELLEQNDEEKTKKEFEREVSIMLFANNPTIAKLIGYSLKGFNGEDARVLIMEYAENGSLEDLFQKLQKDDIPIEYNNTLKTKLQIGICRGMKYLHDRNIINRDLKSSNILLDKNFHPIISDFGFSKYFKPGNSFYQSIECGTPIYMAPEVALGEKYDRKADVFSFGIILYEIVTGLTPYKELIDEGISRRKFVNKIAVENYRPTFPPNMDKNFKDLIKQCLSRDPKKRPSFAELYRKLSNMNKDNKYVLPDVDFDKVNSYINEISKIDDPIEVLLAKNYSLEETNSKLNKNMKSSDEKNKLLKLEIHNLKKKINELTEKIKKIGERNDEKDYKIKELTEKINELEEKNDEKDYEIKELKFDNDYTNTQNDELSRENEKLKTEINELKSKIKEIISDNEQLKQEIINLKSLNEDQQKSTNNNMMTIEGFNNLNIEKKIRTITEILHEFPKKSKKHSFFSRLTDLYSYFQQSFSENYESPQISGPSDLIISNLEKSTSFVILMFNRFIFDRIIKSTIFQSKIRSLHILFALKYPSNNFNENYDICKKSIYNIAIIIDDINQTDSKFNNNNRIKAVKIGNSVKIIKTGENNKGENNKGSFQCCKSLKEVNISSSVELIEEYSFSNCFELTRIYIENSSSSLKKIGDFSFNFCQSLKEITIPSSVISIGKNCFSECNNLEKICFDPNSHLKTVENYTFYKCSSLKTIILPNSITCIGEHAFDECSLLNEIKIPSHVITIHDYAFMNCTSMERIVFEEESALTLFGTGSFYNCKNLVSLIIPAHVYQIKDSSFCFCESLQNVEIPSSVTFIGYRAFAKCSSLTNLSIPNSVTIIDSDVLAECSSLMQVKIPSTLPQDNLGIDQSVHVIPI